MSVYTTSRRWTIDEEERLIEEIAMITEIEMIARIHNRTPKEIQTKIRAIALEMYKNNHPIDDILNKTKISEREMLIIVQKKVEQKNWNNKVVKNTKNKNTKKRKENTDEEINEYNNLQNNIHTLKNGVSNMFSELSDIVNFISMTGIQELGKDIQSDFFYSDNSNTIEDINNINNLSDVNDVNNSDKSMVVDDININIGNIYDINDKNNIDIELPLEDLDFYFDDLEIPISKKIKII